MLSVPGVGPALLLVGDSVQGPPASVLRSLEGQDSLQKSKLYYPSFSDMLTIAAFRGMP